MKPKEKVLDRIEQSFIVFKDNFIVLFFTIFIYNFITFIIWFIFYINFIKRLFSIIINNNINFLDIFFNWEFIYLFTLWFFIFIIILILYIPIFLSLLKSIKDIIKWKEVDVYSNINYWFKNLLNSFKTYWYIFVYVALIPSLIFITWWILLNIWFYSWNLNILKNLWIFLMIFSVLLFICFYVYKWLKSKFSLYSAVNNDSYTKDDFQLTLSYTNNNWLRILWNFILVWLILWLLTWLISSIFTSFIGSSFWDINMDNIFEIQDILKNISYTQEFFRWFINNVFKSISIIFISIFTYIFYLRLKFESEKLNIEEDENNKEL